MITYANSLDPDQDRHSVGPDLDPKLFDTLIVLLKDFFKKSANDKSMKNYPACKELKKLEKKRDDFQVRCFSRFIFLGQR